MLTKVILHEVHIMGVIKIDDIYSAEKFLAFFFFIVRYFLTFHFYWDFLTIERFSEGWVKAREDRVRWENKVLQPPVEADSMNIY